MIIHNLLVIQGNKGHIAIDNSYDNKGYLMRVMTKYAKIGKQVRVWAFVFRIRDQVQPDMF